MIATTIDGALSVTECAELGRVARGSTVTRALEVGHYLGRSTAVLLEHLAPGCELVTVDHHKGDIHSGSTSAEDFLRNVDPYVGERPFRPLFTDMHEALAELDGTFGFVFYDADHSRDGVRAFWQLVQPLLARRCVLVYDDADWDEQAVLGELAAADGFTCIRDRDFHRGPGDKTNPATYTLEVMRR